MEKEDNVYATTLGTEEMAISQNRVESTADKEASAVPEKFKDVDALARAYTALQAEFTRRSQRLKELEKQLDNSNADGGSGAEKLRKNARIKKEENKRFAEFLAETEMRNADEKSDAAEPMEGQPSNGVQLENGDTMYEMKTVPEGANGAEKQDEKMGKASDERETIGKYATPNVALWDTQMRRESQTSVADSECKNTDSETLYAQVCQDENVRLKIIGEYLSSLGRSDVPLMRGGVGTLTTPPRKAASILEAGDMALLYLKRPATK